MNSIDEKSTSPYIMRPMERLWASRLNITTETPHNDIWVLFTDFRVHSLEPRRNLDLTSDFVAFSRYLIAQCKIIEVVMIVTARLDVFLHELRICNAQDLQQDIDEPRAKLDLYQSGNAAMYKLAKETNINVNTLTTLTSERAHDAIHGTRPVTIKAELFRQDMREKDCNSNCAVDYVSERKIPDVPRSGRPEVHIPKLAVESPANSSIIVSARPRSPAISVQEDGSAENVSLLLSAEPTEAIHIFHPLQTRFATNTGERPRYENQSVDDNTLRVFIPITDLPHAQAIDAWPAAEPQVDDQSINPLPRPQAVHSRDDVANVGLSLGDHARDFNGVTSITTKSLTLFTCERYRYARKSANDDHDVDSGVLHIIPSLHTYAYHARGVADQRPGTSFTDLQAQEIPQRQSVQKEVDCAKVESFQEVTLGATPSKKVDSPSLDAPHLAPSAHTKTPSPHKSQQQAGKSTNSKQTSLDLVAPIEQPSPTPPVSAFELRRNANLARNAAFISGMQEDLNAISSPAAATAANTPSPSPRKRRKVLDGTEPSPRRSARMHGARSGDV